MSETLSQDPDTLGSGYGLASNYQPTSAAPSSTVQDPPGSNLPPFSTFAADMDTATGYATDRFLSDTRLLDISNWDYYTEARILDRSENGLSIITSQPQYRPWESKPIDSTSQHGFAQTTAVTTFADAFAQNGVSKLPSFQSQFQSFNEPVTTSEPTLTTLTNLTPVSPNSSSPSLTTLNSNFHTLSAVNPRNYPLVPAPIQAREIPSIQQQFMDERHIQLYAHPTNITTINPAGSIFQSQNGTIIQNSQLMGSPTVLTVIKTEPDLKMTALAPQDTGLKIQNLHPTHFQNPMSTMLDNNGLYNGLDKKLNGLNASSGSPTRNDFRKKERRKMRASSLESSAESDGASSNMDLGSESSGQVAAVSSTASFKTHHSMPTNNSIDIDEISGGGGGVDKQVKKKRKRCGECIGCQRKDNCGDCAPCRNDKSHQICKQRRCEKLTEKKNLYGDQSYMRGESRRGRGKGRGAGSYRGRKPSGPVSLSNSSVPEPSVPSSRPSPQPVHMLKPEQPVQQQQQQQPMAPMPFYADPTRFTTPVWQAEPAQSWPQGQFIQQIPAPAQPTLEAYPTQQYPNGIYQATYQQGGFETNTFYTGAVQVLTNARPPSVPDHSQMTPRTNGSYSHTPSPVSGQPQPQQSAPRNNLSGQYQEYVSNQGYVAPSTPTGVDNSSRPGSVNSTVNVPVSNQNFQQQQPGGGFTSVSSTNFSPGSNTNPNYVNANSGNEKPGYPQVNSHPQLVSHSSSGYPGNQYGGNLQQEEQQTQHWSLNPENIIWETNVQQNDESAKRIGEHDIQYDHNRPPDSPHDHNSRVNLNSRIKTMILNKQQIVERKPEDEQNETENKTGHFLWYSHHRRPPEFLNGGGGGVSTPTPSFDDTFGKSRQKYHQPITIRNNDNVNQFTTNRYPNARIPHPYNEKNFYKQPGHALESVQMFPPPLKQSQMPAEHSYYNQNLHNTTQLENSNYFKFRNGFQTQEHILKTPVYKDLQPNPYVIYNKKNNYKSTELVLKPNELTDKVSNKQSNYIKNLPENTNFPNYKTEKNILHPCPIPTQQYSHGNTKPIHHELMDLKEPRTVLRPTQPIQMNEPHNMNFYKQDLIAKQEIIDTDLCNSKDSKITKNENHCVNPKYLAENFRAQPIKEFPTQIQNIQENPKFYNQINVSENIKPNQSQNEPKSAGTYDPKAFEAKNVNFFRNLNQSINLKEKEMFPNQLDSPNNANYNAKVHYENLKDKDANAFFKTDLKSDNVFKSGEIPSLINRIDSNQGKFIGNDHKKKIDADEKNKFSGSDIPICNCFPPDKLPPEPGSYYTHLGCSNDLVNLRKDLEKRTGVNGKALRIEKVCYTGKEGKSVQGCPLAKWIIRRSNYEEKYLVMVKHRQGHFCISAYIVICLVAWEGVPEADADDMYSMLGDKLNKFGLATNRRCATNEQRTCACQGLDPKTCGASFSFGCSWSMYYNGCKFARSKIVRKFRLTEKNEEQHLETQLQNLASDLTPLYKILAPASFKNQCVYEDEAGECRLGSKEGKPFSGVTACLDFCAHAHKDSHNMNNGCTVVVTLTKERSLAKAEDEQLHVLPLYTVDCTDEFGSKESQDDKIKDGSVEVLNSYQCEVRIRTVPLQPCRRRKKKDDENAKESPAKKDNVSSRLSSSSGYDSSRSQTPLTPNKNVDQMLQSSQISSTVLDSPVTPKSWTYDSPGYNQSEENWYQTASSNINSPENVFYNNAKPTVLSQPKPNTAFTPTYPKIELQTRSPQSAQNNLLQNKVQDNYSGIRNGNRLFSHCNTGIDFNTGILNNPTNDEISSSRTLHLDKTNGFYPKSDFQTEPFKIPFTPESSPIRVSPKTFPLEASQPYGESQDVQRLNHISHMQCYQRERATVASPYVYPDLYHLPPGTQNLQNMFHRLPPHEQNLELMTPFRGHRNIEYDQMETYQRRERNSEIPLECSQPMSFKSQIQQNGFSISGKDSTNICNGSYQNYSFEHKKEVQNLNLNLNSSKSVEDDKILLDSPRKSSPPKLNLIDTSGFTPIQIPKSYQLCNPFDDFGDYGIKKQESRIISNSGYDPYLSPSWQSPKSWDVNVPLPEQTESLGKVVDVVDNAESFKDSQIGGVAIALGHGSVLFECAKHELHATTALKRPNRKSPTRISLVFYQHRNLNRAKHGWDEWEEKTRLKKLGLNDAQNTDLKFKVGNEKIDVPDFNTVLLKNNNEVLMRAPTLTTVSVTTLFPMYPCIVTGPYTETQSFG